MEGSSDDRGVAHAVTSEQTVLGEGIRWDARRDEVLRVDILRGRVYRDRVLADGRLAPVQQYEIGTTVGAIAPIEGDDGWILAAGRGLLHLRPDGRTRPIAALSPADTRMNDAACDPQGRFWAGTIADDRRPGGASLYRLDRSGRTEMVLEDLTISNGIGWSPDGTVMYLVDSGPRHVRAYDFDGGTGAISAARVLVDLADGPGAPDGMTVDAAGDLWVALYGGSCVHRYGPDGRLREVVEVPAEETTCAAFCGPGLDQLYVTTATEHWTDDRRRGEPGAGLVYRVATTATGRPAAPYRPDPAWWSAI